MKINLKLVLGAFTFLITSSAQSQTKSTPEDVLKWKGFVNMIGEYSSYQPAFQVIPSSYGYLSSVQQLNIEGIPFQGSAFLSSYQGASLNRYSFSFDTQTLQRTVQARVEHKISSLQEIPSIGALDQELNEIQDPNQYDKLSGLNERLQEGESQLNQPDKYSALINQQNQLARYNPDEYQQYEQFVQLKTLDQKQDYKKEMKMLKGQGLISSAEALWYNFDALQVGTTAPYFSDLDLAGVPVKGYYAAYNSRHVYAAVANGNALPFNVPDSLMSFSRLLRAYKLGMGSVSNSHLHLSYVHGEDLDRVSTIPPIANTIAGLDGRVKLLRGKLDIKARTYLGVYTSNLDAQAETNIISSEEVTKILDLGKWISEDAGLNSSTVSGNAHHVQMTLRDKQLHLTGEYRRVDPKYKSVGLAYLQSDVERIQLSIDQFILNKNLRLYGKIRRDEDNLNGAKNFTSTNINAIIKVHSYFKKLPRLSFTYMPNIYTNTALLANDKLSHKSQMFNLTSSKTYRFLNLNHASSGSFTYNAYKLQSGRFSSISTSVNQRIMFSSRIRTGFQIVYRQTNTSYYWSMMPSFTYNAKQGTATISFRYGEDYLQNSRYALNIGTRMKLSEKLLFGLSIIQNYYTQTTRIEDLRVRSSIKLIW